MVSTFLAAIAPSIGKVIEYKSINDNGGGLKSPDDVPFAKQQAQIWQRNLDCTGLNQRWFDAGQLRFSAVFCPDTGDIMVQYKFNPNGKQYVHWIEHNDRRSDDQAMHLLIPPARASLVASAGRRPPTAEPAALLAQEFRSIFQAKGSAATIVRIVQKADGQCTRQIINSYTGQLRPEPIGRCTPGLCTFLPEGSARSTGYGSVSPARRIVDDNCIVGRPGSNRIDLTWSTGQVMKVSLNPAAVDGQSARVLQSNPGGALVKTRRGTVGWRVQRTP